MIGLLSLLLSSTCPQAVVIMPSTSGVPELGLSQIHREVAGLLARRVCLKVLPFEAVFVSDGDAAFVRCGADDGCLRESVARTGASSGLLVAVVKTADAWLLSTRLLGPGGQQQAASDTGEADADARQILRRLGGLVERVLDDAGIARGARLRLTVEPSNAEVKLTLAGEPTPHDRPLPAGRYQLRLDAEGYQPLRRELDLTAGKDLELDLSLIANATPVYETWWFWTAIGVAVVASAVTVGVLAGRRSPCVCSAARLEDCEALCGDL